MRYLNVTNYILHLLTTLILTSLQCSLWLQFFGYFPAPLMWQPVIAFWAVYRNLSEGLLMTYLLTITTVSLSAIPLSLFLFLNLVCFVVAKAIKQRIYWSGPTYLMLISGTLSLFFPLGHFILSWAIEPNPITDPEILDSILSALFTVLMAMPLYFLFVKIDQKTNKELPTDVGATNYE